jgi:acetyltransferase-like isoleucine patch superfamily enzyme
MKKIFSLIILFFPWRIRFFLYTFFFKYEIDYDSYIGFSWLYPEHLILKKGAKIGHLNFCKNIKLLKLEQNSIIGALNWITGFPIIENYSGHFSKEKYRMPQLLLGKHSAITSRHYIDCTNSISIGDFSTIAGLRSQFLTHSINIQKSEQGSERIEIGMYCFLGSGCTILSGSRIPDYSVIGAMSLVNKQLTNTYTLYAGVPVEKLKDLPVDSKYFLRAKGFVV